MNRIWGILASLLVTTGANATLIQGAGSLPNAHELVIPALNYIGTGPVHFGNATWTSNYPDSLFGSTTPFAWDSGVAGSPGEPIMRINQDQLPDYITMTVTFDTPVKGVLAKLFWNNSAASPFGYNSGNSAFFAAYPSMGPYLTDPGCIPSGASANCVWQLNDNGANPNRFGGSSPPSPGYFGYSFAQPVIKSITFSNRLMGVSRLYITAVPEPASWALLVTGFGLVGAAQRRRRPVAA